MSSIPTFDFHCHRLSPSHAPSLSFSLTCFVFVACPCFFHLCCLPIACLLETVSRAVTSLSLWVPVPHALRSAIAAASWPPVHQVHHDQKICHDCPCLPTFLLQSDPLPTGLLEKQQLEQKCHWRTASKYQWSWNSANVMTGTGSGTRGLLGS